jgi:adenine-specific DNA-methyltransferase
MATEANSIILDSFAGSGTTAQGVLEANKEEGGTRKFILIEMEDYADKLTSERVRRVIKGVPKARDEALRTGLGESFTYCELGDPIDLEKFFEGKGAPSYEQVARYVIYTATGASVGKVPNEPKRDWFIGEAGGYRVHLIYKPDVDFMRSNDAALTMTLASQIFKSAGAKPVLVYAAQKFMSQAELTKLGITFCQLPYSVYRILGDAPDAA